MCEDFFTNIATPLFFPLTFSRIAMKIFFPLFLSREMSGIAMFAIETQGKPGSSSIFSYTLPDVRFSFSLLTTNFNIHEDININKNININIDIYEYECRCVNIHGTEYYTRIESSRKANRRQETRGSDGRSRGRASGSNYTRRPQRDALHSISLPLSTT